MDQEWKEKKVNFERCHLFVKKAKADDCQAIVFPEMTLTGYTLEIEEASEKFKNENSVKSFGKLAKIYGIYIFFGTVISSNDSITLPSNSLCLATPQGKCNVIYDKIHPFSYANEDKYFRPGKNLCKVTICGFRIGAAICYDLRFPELFSIMAPNTDLIMIIANWPKKRIDHWYALLRARAIENQCYLVGVNRIGTDGNGIEYQKSSVIYSPQGVKIDAVKESKEIDIYQLDVDEVAKYRNEFPTLKDKRFYLYRKFLKIY